MWKYGHKTFLKNLMDKSGLFLKVEMLRGNPEDWNKELFVSTGTAGALAI